MCIRWMTLVLVLLTWGAPEGRAGPRSAAAAEMVRHDWYFRESLNAIRDWEGILASGDVTPAAEQTPVFPVPVNGAEVAWPNPVPSILMPVRDAGTAVHLRLVEKTVELTRRHAAGQSITSKTPVGQAVRGYKHPGGGGKDRWYHAYHRRFDRLTTFRPVPAPIALALEGAHDWKRGDNVLTVEIRNVGEQALDLDLRLRLFTRGARRECGARSVDLAPGVLSSQRFPVVLDAAGGGLLVLTVKLGETTFWVPLLTHVEQVQSVLEGIGKILDECPDQRAAEDLARMRQRVNDHEGSTEEGGTMAWRQLFEEASALRDALLLRRLEFDTLLFIKRKPFDSEQPFMDAHHLRNRPGGGIYRLEPVRPGGKVTPVIDTLGEGVYRDLHLHWEAQKFLFAFGNGSDRWDGRQSYHLYEIGVNGQGLRQLTTGPKNDCEPLYLPSNQIGFTSDRSEHFVMCGGNRHSPNLFVMENDGANVRQLSFNVFNDFNPTLLPDGRILYSRWEYNERSVTSLHNPFTINPDGTMMAPFYGNATIRPNVVMFPRPVPGSDMVMALFTAHHGQTHGAIGLIDVKKGIDGPGPLTVLTPGVPVTGEKAEDSTHGWYSDPVPLSETTYLCSFTPTVVPWLERSWALYVGDQHGNLALVHRDEKISCAEPVPLVTRPRPHVLPAAPANTNTTSAEASLLLMDVYVGMPGVPRGTARYLRILEDLPRKSVPEGNIIITSGTSIYTIKRIFGTVPIESDGSAYFKVPANRNIYFEVLDENRREIQRMRSVVCLKPGEERTCIGCHEPRYTSPPNRPIHAAYREPSRPDPPPWGARTISFLRDVQPLINDRCIACHTHDRTENMVILTDDLTDQFSIGYEELLPYISVANSMRWDHPDDVLPQPPYTYGSKVSRLVQLLEEGHHDVVLSEEEWRRLLCWIDANGVYYDSYENRYHGTRHIFNGPGRKTLNDVYSRRCASCHGQTDGRHGTWWLSINWREVSSSKALRAPLSRQAGGWGRCGESVFATKSDPDYRRMLTALTNLRRALQQRPRQDLHSLQGSEAKRQKVDLPPPPPPRPPERDMIAAGWIPLSRVQWTSAHAGWTPNKDGLPRLDRNIEGSMLRLGQRIYRHGVGTHAPSEIVYQLDGEYGRLVADVGVAEANGTAVFRVLGDGRALFDSGLMRGQRQVKHVDIDIAGVQELQLIVTDAGDGIICDTANWAGARLLRK